MDDFAALRKLIADLKEEGWMFDGATATALGRIEARVKELEAELTGLRIDQKTFVRLNDELEAENERLREQLREKVDSTFITLNAENERLREALSEMYRCFRGLDASQMYADALEVARQALTEQEPATEAPDPRPS